MSSFVSFIFHLIAFYVQDFCSLGRFIPVCFIIFVVMVNEIVSLISLSDISSVLEYKVFLCVKFIYLTETLLYSFITCSNLLVAFLGFYLHSIRSSANFPIKIPFTSFFFSKCCGLDVKNYVD